MEITKIIYSILLLIILPFFISWDWILENELHSFIMIFVGVIVGIIGLVKDQEIKPPEDHN